MEKQITVRLPQRLASALDEMAGRSGLKRSDIVRLAIQAYVSEQAEEEARPYDLVRHLIGKAQGVLSLDEPREDPLAERIRRHAVRPA